MKELRSTILFISGVVSIVFSTYCFKISAGEYCTNSEYGGDAFTGIQNTSAAAARNILTLTKVVKTGFGSILLVGGFALIAFSISDNRDENYYVSALPTSDGNNETVTEDKQNEAFNIEEQTQTEEVKV